MPRIISALYVLILALLTLLSYTQVDLNLTLLNWQPYLNIQKHFTTLGYFNRPLNGTLFLLLCIALVMGYLALVKSAHANWLTIAQLKKLAFFSSLILLFSYSIFSHDIFNYIFDARIVTFYGQNPYQHKALDYPQDDWIRFMQWTHRTYPYGPSWLAITLIPSFLGFAKLLPTYLLFKAMFVAAYHILLYYSLKILKLRTTKPHILATSFALLAFNPLILVDGLVSSRIDLVMAATAITAIYYHIQKSYWSYFWLIFSGGIKFATLGFLPVFITGYTKLKDKNFFLALFILSLVTVIAQSVLRGLQPWYFLLPITILPFMYPHWRLKKIILLTLIMLLPMSTYLYLLYTGISLDALWFLSP